MRKKKKRKRKRIGISLLFASALFATLSNYAGDKKASPAAYALIGGTVFQQAGYALPGALVALIPESNAGQTSGKRMQTQSDARGEFVFRVAPGPQRYTIRVSAKNYEPQEKPAAIENSERIDVTFQLLPESK